MQEYLTLILILLFLVLMIVLPAAWVVSEFRDKRWLRITLSIMTMALYFSCFALANRVGTGFEYNAYYGKATDDLIKTSLQQIEDGNLERVLKVWRGLNFQFRATYENRAGYAELVAEATRLMKGVDIEPGTTWDAPMFDATTWHGHWESDDGFWLVIDRYGNPFDFRHCGNLPHHALQFVSLSPDNTVLKFQEEDRWMHTLTLKNKYEATHEWFSLESNSICDTKTLNKLIQASEEQKGITQQND